MDQVLAAWNLVGAEVSFHAERENRIFKVTHAGLAYALREHRPGLRTRAQIEAELTWMASLAEQGLPVPQPLQPLVQEVDSQRWSLITWLPGKPLGYKQDALDLPDPIQTFTALGGLLRELHDLPTPPGLDRPRWTAEEMLGPDPLWGRFWEHPDLSAEDREMVIRFRGEAFERLHVLDLPVKLIHADPLQENVLVEEERVYLIDFDDSTYSYPLFDLTTPLVQRLPDPSFAMLRDALLAGYGKPVDREALALLFVVRCLTYMGWIMDKMETAEGQAMSGRIVQRAVAQTRAWFEGQSPILS